MRSRTWIPAGILLVAGLIGVVTTPAGAAGQQGAPPASATQIREAGAVLDARAWHPKAATASYGYFFDSRDATYHIGFAARDRAVADALKARLGALVTVSVNADVSAAAPAGDRFNDAAPHFGGSYVVPDSATARQCTTGFTVVDGFGLRGSVTAGHCPGSGAIVNYFSTSFHGQTQGSVVNATKDMSRLHGLLSTTYASTIHTGPSAPTSRRVVGKGDPLPVTTVCVSGALTGARCNVLLLGLGNGTACENGVCTGGLMVGERTDVDIVQEGDSGGPVYTQSGSTGAIIRGMIVGNVGSHTVLAHRVSQVEAGLGVTVATS